jgi:hypothetical protein
MGTDLPDADETAELAAVARDLGEPAP